MAKALPDRTALDDIVRVILEVIDRR
jgi:hypothetical protein